MENKKTITDVEFRKELRKKIRTFIKSKTTGKETDKLLKDFNDLCVSYEKTTKTVLAKIINLRPSVNREFTRLGYESMESFLEAGEAERDDLPVQKKAEPVVKKDKPVKEVKMLSDEEIEKRFNVWIKKNKLEKSDDDVKKVLKEQFAFAIRQGERFREFTASRNAIRKANIKK